MALPTLTAEFASGLRAATQAMAYLEGEICTPADLQRVAWKYINWGLDIRTLSVGQRKMALVAVVRKCADEKGWLEGWKCLVDACPDCGVHEEMLKDIEIGVNIFQSVDVATKHRPTIDDVTFTVVSNPTPGRIDQIGPKSLGGRHWQDDPEYHKAFKAWRGPVELMCGPCPFFAWIGICKKVPKTDDPKMLKDFWSAQLLGTVDYDLDQDEEGEKTESFTKAMQLTAKMGAEDKGMRGVAWTGLLTMDQQSYNRHVQYKWVAEGKGVFVTGPNSISPDQYLRAAVADCAALTPFAYERAADYISSRKGMFVSVLNSNLHDLIYDIGSSSRISCAGYAYATGSFEYDLPQALIIGIIDAVATACSKGPPDQSVLYGFNTMFASCLWDLFNVRYRAWERLIKYTRLLRRSKSSVAKRIMNHAKDNMVFRDVDLDAEVDSIFNLCLDPNNVAFLVPRNSYTEIYVLPNRAAALARCPDFNLPELCESCKDSFEDDFFQGDDVQVIKHLPESIFISRAVSMAAAIRRASLWATSDKCCDACACVVATWANFTSDRVTVASMQSEQTLSTRNWLLECYVVGCVAFSPLRLISITGGFDSFADIQFEPGAMGDHRDLVDC